MVKKKDKRKYNGRKKGTMNDYHLIRCLSDDKKTNSNPEYGITIPYEYIKKYKLKNKKFKMHIIMTRGGEPIIIHRKF